MTKLTEMKVNELQAIAKEKGIALSYTKEGKRHKLNKAELIAAIETKQADQAPTKQVETTPVVNEVKAIQSEINLNTVVKNVRELLASQTKDSIMKVNTIVNELNKMIVNEKRNKLLVARMSRTLNIIKSLVKQQRKAVQYA